MLHESDCQIALLVNEPSLPAVSHAEKGHSMDAHGLLLWLLAGRDSAEQHC